MFIGDKMNICENLYNRAYNKNLLINELIQTNWKYGIYVTNGDSSN